MSERKTITHQGIMCAALILSVMALPFSQKVCHAGMILLISAWFIEGQWGNKLNIINRSILLRLILALFLIQVVGLAYSDNFAAGWFVVEKKIFFFLVPLALATTAIRLSEKQIKLIFYSFIISCFTGTLLCILHAWNQAEIIMAGNASVNPYLATSSYHDLNPFQSEKWEIFSYTSLSEGINIHPTYFSLYLGFGILFLLHELHRIKSRGIQTSILILALYFALFVIFLSSRIIILGLSIIFIFVLIRSLMAKERPFAFVVMLIAFLFSILLFINPVSRYRSLQEINLSTFVIQPENTYENAAQIRVSLWWLALKSLQQSHPFWGAGTGDVEMEMKQASNRYRITNILGSFDPHNQFLYTLIGNGLIGLLLLILCLGLPAYFAWCQKDYILLGFLFLFSLLCFTESALELQKGIVFYTLFLSLLVFQHNSFQSITLNLRSMLRAGN